MTTTFATYGTAETLLGSTERLRYNIWYEENVLSYPKLLTYDVLFRENVLDGTNFMSQ